jgi:VanZ family protein
VKFVEKLKISDKIEHFFAYAVLGLLLTLALHMQNKFERLNSNYGFWSVVIIAIYAALDEIHQLFIPNRSGEILDWLADFLGALIASLLIRKFIKRFSEPVSTELSS